MTFPFSFSRNAFVDLSSYDAFNEGAPFATFERLRRDEPVAWCADSSGGRGFWSVTRHADILALNRNTELLSSAKGIRIEDQSKEEFEARKTFQETDPPLHRHFRALVNKAFAKSTIAGFSDQIRQMVVEILDEAFSRQEFDAVDAIARQLPMRMLARILGVPDSDATFLVDRGDALISNSDPDFTDYVVDRIDTEEYRLLPFRSPAALELFDYANLLLKRIDAGEDLGVLSLVRREVDDGSRMSDGEFRNLFCLLVAAGNDTTRYALAASIHALANQPSLLKECRSGGAELFETAIDELIRWASPTSHFRRTVTRDFELHGKNIRAGDKLVLWFLSGNRDETVFAQPYEINLRRKPNPHVAFGQGGPHICLGMWLAKLEVQLVLEEMSRRLVAIEQTAPHSFLRSNFIHGIKRLPVRVTHQ